MSAVTNGPGEMPLLTSTRRLTTKNEDQAEGSPVQVPKGKKSWIYTTFKKRTCCQFIPSRKEVRRCCCGRLDKDHKPETTRLVPNIETEWEVSKHTELEPTNAYGELEFTGAGQTSRAKFVRIAHDTDPEAVLRLLRREWRLELPKLLISVTGGAKNFTLHPKLKHVLRQGLLKAAETTGAWIITGGTNTGVMRHVGEAVKGHTVMSRGAQQSRDKGSQLHLLGIATWGIVDHRQELIDSQGIVTYHMTSSLLSEGACLDNNHSHFILVDDGTVGKYGGEICFRASLQNCISSKKISRNKSHGIPVVMLVLEGGPNTILTVLESVTSNPAVPVVIAEGSGRAADILAHAHSLITSNDGVEMDEMSDVVDHQQLMLRIQKAFPGCSEEKYREIYQKVLKCVGNKRYVTIFRMDEDGIDIDRAILRALLKAQHASAADQLSLGLIWNRADIARTEIFTEDQKWEMSTLEDAMMDALKNNRVEFVKLLLENGVSMSHFLTRHRLEELYRGRAGSVLSVVFRQMIGHEKIKSGFTLHDVNNALRKILGTAYKGKAREYKTVKTALSLADSRMVVDGYNQHMAESSHVVLPYKKLFLWAVFCNMQQMALFMWERGEENLAGALLAAKMYSVMAKISGRNDAQTDVANELYAHAKEFKALALGLLDQCHRANEDLTQKLLTYHLGNWGGQTCLSLAVAIEHEEFLAHSSCQTLLTNIWTGAMKIEHRSSIKTVLGILLPPAIFFLGFKNKQEMLLMPMTLEEHEQDWADDEETNEEQDNLAFRSSATFPGKDEGIELRSATMHTVRAISVSRDLYRGHFQQERAREPRVLQLGRGRKLLEFYKAPVTKFWSNMFAYLAFLVLFSYVILVHQEKVPSISEIILIIFVCSLCTEEIRQILHSEPPTLRNKIQEWGSSRWNLLDAVAVLLFFVGLGLRLHLSTRRAGHVVYCLDVMLWIIRLLDIFSVSKHLGPYVVMIGRMTIDMLYFLVIMVIFLLAYGVAQQAILYPNERASWSMLSQIFFRPYFQVYGELFVDAPDTVDSGTTFFGTPRRDDHGDTIATFIMAFYLLVANILLLNLLIAIFNNTFSSVQANANQIWKFQRYHLVMEYAQRPVLIPPFIILNHIIHLFKGLRHCCRRKGKRQGVSDHGLKLFLDKDGLHEMTLFEERCVDSYLREKDTLLHATHEEKIKVMGDRLESVSSQVQDVYKEATTQATALKKVISSMDTRLSRLEEHTHRIVGLLERLQMSLPDPAESDDINKHLQNRKRLSLNDIELSAVNHRGHRPLSGRLSYDKDHRGGVLEAASRLKSLTIPEEHRLLSQGDSGEKISGLQLSEPTGRSNTDAVNVSSLDLKIHVRARQSPYPRSNQRRYPVPDFLVDWKVSFPGYDPLLYTADEILAGLPWSYPDILDPNTPNVVINFNRMDGDINRCSHTGMYDVVNQLPRNPAGRTGIAGRGLFGRWGPNHAAHLIVTRWKIGKTEEKETDKKVLEYVAMQSQDGLELPIPGGLIEAGETVSMTLKRQLIENVFSALKTLTSEDLEDTPDHVNKILQNSFEIYKGCIDDPRNTDNAWLETTAMHFHDETGETLGHVEFKAEDESHRVQWREVSGHTDVHSDFSFMLCSVAQLHDAYFV